MKRRAAFFDMDKTLVRVNTGRLYVRWRFVRGESGVRDVARATWWSFQYLMGVVDATAVSSFAARTLTGRDEESFAAECREWYGAMVRPYVSDAARREVERRRAAGDLLAILSGSSPYAAGPLAAELGIEHVLASRFAVVEGRFTGEVEPPLCFGDGKVIRATAWAHEHDVDLAASAFYTDSISDLPMLERVGEPRVVNPDPRLSRVARARRWPIEHWR
jgi:HAD superfamily hydrolase (TIGR01490 family)